MSRLTNTQRVILSSASRRNDRGVDLPTNVTGEALCKAVDKLIQAGLLEEVRANGSLLGWRRDAEAGPMALRITKQGLEAIAVEDEPADATEETPICAAAAPKLKASAGEATASRKRTSATSQKPRKTHQPVKAKTKAGSPRKNQPGSKQSRVIAMLRSPAGATIAAMMKTTGWQQHSVRGFLAGVVRKRLKLKLGSKKVDGVRVYQIAGLEGRKRGPRKSERQSP
jgi:Protein of unknown function (DUF3489)